MEPGQLDRVASFNNTALHLAAKRASSSQGHQKCITLLLESSAEPQRQNADGDTPLILATRGAALHGNVAGIQALLENGADPCVLNHRRESALTVATSSKSMELTNLLWSYLSWDAPLRNQPEILAHLVSSGNLDLVKSLPVQSVEKPGWLDRVQEQTGLQVSLAQPKSVLWWGVYFHQLPIIRWALNSELDKGNIPTADSQGRTLLHWLAIWGRQTHVTASSHAMVVEALCKHGVEPSAKDNSGSTAMDVACTLGASAVVEALVEYADEDMKATAAQFAVQNGHDECAHLTGSWFQQSRAPKFHHRPVYSEIVEWAKYHPEWKFTDNTFPPCCTSLSPEGCLPQYAAMSWERASSVWSGESLSKPVGTVCMNGASWFWASIMNADADASLDPASGVSKCGVYLVKLRGQQVIVDDFIPVVDGEPAFNQPNLWAAIMLKAHAKLVGSYQQALHPSFENSGGIQALNLEDANSPSLYGIIEDGLDTTVGVADLFGETLKTAEGLNSLSQSLHEAFDHQNVEYPQRARYQHELPVYHITLVETSEPTTIMLSTIGAVPSDLTVSHHAKGDATAFAVESLTNSSVIEFELSPQGSPHVFKLKSSKQVASNFQLDIASTHAIKVQVF